MFEDWTKWRFRLAKQLNRHSTFRKKVTAQEISNGFETLHPYMNIIVKSGDIMSFSKLYLKHFYRPLFCLVA